MKRTFELPNRISELGLLLDQLESHLIEDQIPPDVVGEMRLLAEEAVSNIIRYAHGSEEEHRIKVTLSGGKKELALEIRDQGRPFNPLDAPPPHLDLPIEERPEGGLGIHLMKSLADEASYAREGRTNVLVLKKRI